MLKQSPDTRFHQLHIQNTEHHLTELIKRIPWKPFYQTDRMVCSLGKSYPYSGQVTVGESFDYYPPLFDLMQRLNNELGTGFNSVLLNWYPKGKKVGIGKHSDDEKELVEQTPVVSISLGESTMFILRAKEGRERRELILGDGDVFIMGVDCQKHYTHECPYVLMKGDRISLTFRQFK